MPFVTIDALDDPRLWPYRALKERDLRQRDARFIAEGRLVVERLLANRRFATESVLCNERLADALAERAMPDVEVFVAPPSVVNATVGFRFHNGCLAVGRSPAMPGVATLLDEIGDGPATIVVADELNNTENLGAILRITAGFGVAGVIFGPRSADPFFRQSIRVSMGAVFALPLARSDDVPRDLALLCDRGYEVIATVARDAGSIRDLVPRRRQAIVLGGEAHGLNPITVAACTRVATIPMQLGTDSLNVSIAAAVFLYHLTVRQEPAEADPAKGTMVEGSAALAYRSPQDATINK